MKLQLALDMPDLDHAQRVLAQVSDLIDIIEIGTPLLLHAGVRAVTAVKQRYPHCAVLADMKIIDAGDLEARLAYEADADIVTVLGCAHDITIRHVVERARAERKQVVADLITVRDLVLRVSELETLGVDILCVHTAFDTHQEGAVPVEALRAVAPVRQRAALAVAGGVTPATLPLLTAFQPDIIVVGGFITNHPQPRQAVSELRTLMPLRA